MFPNRFGIWYVWKIQFWGGNTFVPILTQWCVRKKIDGRLWVYFWFFFFESVIIIIIDAVFAHSFVEEFQIQFSKVFFLAFEHNLKHFLFVFFLLWQANMYYREYDVYFNFGPFFKNLWTSNGKEKSSQNGWRHQVSTEQLLLVYFVYR